MNPVELLASVPLFAGLDVTDLERLCRGSRQVSLTRGDRLFAEGDPGNEAFVITAGEIEIIKHSVGRDVLLAVRHEGDVIGEMSLLEDAPRMASARARTDASVLTIPKEHLDQVLATSQTALRALFEVLLARRRQNEASLQQSERMAQLGTLTAGLAHELNNPAAAVHRAAEGLAAAVATHAAARAAVGRELPEALAALVARTGDVAARSRLDALARSDAEADLEQWLEDAGIPDPWDCAPPLVAAGIDRPSLEDIAGVTVEDAIRLLVASATVHDLLFQIGEGSRRMSEIVGALKSYSFLDRAPVQDVDVVRGIEDTLLLMRSRIGTIRVVRDFTELPPIPGYGSELNQVWTNLIDNAVYAIGEGGGSTLTIRARREGDAIVVEVEDDGPGIPPDIQRRIFDSFFTTKPPGKGTGLGLDISYGIVVNRHGGDITADSTPGRTTFRVSLPVSGPPS